MPLATSSIVLSSSPVTVSSKVSVKLPDSPHDEGPGASGIATVVVASIVVSSVGVGTSTVIGTSCRFASNVVPSSSSSNTVVTTVLKRLDRDEKISKDGRTEIGVWRSVRVVKGIVCRSDGSGPVTVGYIPVQYDTVVEMLGDGKTKLIATSPYDITFVIARALNKDVALKPGAADDVASGEVVVVNVNVEVRILCETGIELDSELDAVLAVGLEVKVLCEMRTELGGDLDTLVAVGIEAEVLCESGTELDSNPDEVVAVRLETKELCEIETELDSELDDVVADGRLMLLPDDEELPAKELDPIEELVMVLGLNSVEEVDVKFKLSVDDEFVIGNSVAKPAEVLELSMLVNG